MSFQLTSAPRSSGGTGKCFRGGCVCESRGGRRGQNQYRCPGCPPPGKISGSVHASVCFVPEEKSMSCLLTGAPWSLGGYNVEWFGVWELTYTDGVLGAGAGSRLIGGALTLGTLWKYTKHSVVVIPY